MKKRTPIGDSIPAFAKRLAVVRVLFKLVELSKYSHDQLGGEAGRGRLDR
jgi:hypothetical protein